MTTLSTATRATDQRAVLLSGTVTQILKDLDVGDVLPVDHCRRAAQLRRGLEVSAVDAVVAEAADRTTAAAVVTSDPEGIGALLDRAGAGTVVITV